MELLLSSCSNNKYPERPNAISSPVIMLDASLKPRNPDPDLFIYSKMDGMQKLVSLLIFTLLCVSCEKGEFDPNNPDIEEFIQHLKGGTYKYYEKGEDEEDLWLLMPKFSKNHIPSLLNLSIDTSHIKNFPINPLASHSPYPTERPYYILGECLLWTVEGIRNGTGYGSLTPYLIDTTFKEKIKVLNGDEILYVRDLYLEWWNTHKDGNWKNNNPLEVSSYKWR